MSYRGKYLITSPGGIKAAKEKIEAIEKQVQNAVAMKNPDSARTYRAVIVALRAILSAGGDGIAPTQVQMKIRQQAGRFPLSRSEQQEIMQLVSRHVMPIMEAEALQREREAANKVARRTTPVAPVRSGSSQPRPHSLARERLEQTRLK